MMNLRWLQCYAVKYSHPAMVIAAIVGVAYVSVYGLFPRGIPKQAPLTTTYTLLAPYSPDSLESSNLHVSGAMA